MAGIVDDETTPLVAPANAHEIIYQRFTPARKRAIVAIVSLTGLLPLFVSGTFIPSIPQIAKDLNTTGSVVSLAVSLSVFAASLGGLLGASYSTFYGRKPIYLVGTPLLFAASVGVGMAQSVPQLMFWRLFQSIGASPGLAVGSGVIGDIYKLEERGAAMGTFFAAILLGPALAPLAGGLAAHYFSWRAMQFCIAIFGLVAFFCVLWLLPETYHPGERGIDKMPAEQRPRWRPVFLNPFQSLALLRSPNLLAVAMAGFLILLTDYILMVPLAYTIGECYNIRNEAVIGACFLPSGVGSMVGARLAGRLSDKLVIRHRKARGGTWYPEDRLRVTLYAAFFFVPLSVLFSGLLTAYVPGKIGLTLNLVCLFFNGVGVDMVFSPSAAYFVDLMHSRSAETVAANNGFRSIFMSIAISGILPSIALYGVAITNTVAAVGAWLGFLLLFCTVRYGERLRAYVDVGFSTSENN